MDQRALVEIKC